MFFFILIKRVLIFKMIKKRENNERKCQCAAASKTKGVRSSDVRRVVTRKETSLGIRSSGLIHSEILQETLEGKKTEVLDGV